MTRTELWYSADCDECAESIGPTTDVEAFTQFVELHSHAHGGLMIDAMQLIEDDD